MHGGDYFYLGVQFAAWNFTGARLHHIHFPANFFKLLTTPILLVGQLQSAAC